MPIYEFSCDKCGKEFEELIFNDAQAPCPFCGSSHTRKMMSACARSSKNESYGDYAPSTGGGCSGCSGGNCASCGH